MSRLTHRALCQLLSLFALLLLPVFVLPDGLLNAQEAPVSYKASIQPLFEAKCVSCHACNDAPCQLNLGSGNGLQRGASKIKVYDGTRTKAQSPTRLFTDAETTQAWRDKGFYSVLGDQPDISLLARVVAMGQQKVPEPNSKLSSEIPIGTDIDNQCPANEDELAKFTRKYPHRGMPMGVTGLTAQEYDTLTTWLKQGAPVDSEPVLATAAEEAQIAEWEKLLNQPGKREQLVSRWIYEHLFLAHLYFENIKDSHFFELVRSRTPSGKPISLIATPQPNDPPDAFVYYRLRPIQGAIVHKTHITYPLTPAGISRIHELFYSGNWSVGSLPGYGTDERANPFTTFAAIPSRARYQFMLDHAEYFVRTFIRGPVCRGNIATDVIRDNFWAIFQTPDSDLYVTSADHRQRVNDMLGVPGQKDGLGDLFPQWTKYTKLRNRYTEIRNQDYAKREPKGPSFNDIWNGEGHNQNALLSIYRHHDSALVQKGLWGEFPQTVWWMDYPLFERTYYGLVANFNVYDTVSHQAQTRLYFDLIRNGAEMNFLRLMPPSSRQGYMDDWYQKSGKLKMWLYYPTLDRKQPTAISLSSSKPKEEFLQQLLNRVGTLNARPDPINRCDGKQCFRPQAPAYARHADQALSRMAARPATQMPVIRMLPEATVLRVYTENGQREIYTLLRNRAHSNVAYMAAESLRYQPDKDTLTIFPGVLTSYPNFAFNVPEKDIDDFSQSMQAVSRLDQLEVIIKRWGVRRTHPDFWKLFHDYTAYIRETEPFEAGILDMNRYENL